MDGERDGVPRELCARGVVPQAVRLRECLLQSVQPRSLCTGSAATVSRAESTGNYNDDSGSSRHATPCLLTRFCARAQEYCVVDFLWYQCDWHYAGRAACDSDDPTWLVDDFGRPLPDPLRWPSAANGVGFRAVSDRVHALGMKFGIHIMVGTSKYALNKTVKGTNFLVSDVIGNDACPWPSHGSQRRCTCQWQAKSLDINVSHPGGRAFYDSLYEQYAGWEVDMIKNDCVFGLDYRPDQIKYQSDAIRRTGRPIVYSLSPGGILSWAPAYDLIAQAKEVGPYVNMYRVTNDAWDEWSDIAPTTFDAAHNSSALIGAPSRNGRSWPDMDMLALGWIGSASDDDGPDHWANLTLDEQRTQVTLWSIARSPLFFGGDLRRSNLTTLSLLQNSRVLAIDCCSHSNRQVVASSGVRVWTAASGDNATVYVALFNLQQVTQTVTATFEQLDITWKGLSLYDVWTNKSVPAPGGSAIAATLGGHSTRLLAVRAL